MSNRYSMTPAGQSLLEKRPAGRGKTLRPSELIHLRVFVYWNLRKRRWSIKALSGSQKGKVIAHSDTVVVAECSFKVSEAGRQRVLREKRKNVHAGVVGTLVSLTNDGGMWDYVRHGVPVSYNPYKGNLFYEKLTGKGYTVTGAQRVLMEKVGKGPFVSAMMARGPMVGGMRIRA